MVDHNNGNNPQNEDNSGQEDPQREINEPVSEMYLPDLMNTPLSEALRNEMQMKNDFQILVECPLLKEIYGVDTLLVDKDSGACKLYTGLDEPEPFPLPCNKVKYPPPQLTEKGARSRHKTTHHTQRHTWKWTSQSHLGVHE